MVNFNQKLEPLTALFNEHRVLLSLIEREPAISIYLVGGLIRDSILYPDRQIKPDKVDIDLTIEGDSISFVKELAEKFDGTAVVLSQRDGTARLVLSSGTTQQKIDVTDLRRATITEDLQARDFTVNSLALPLNAIRKGADIAGIIDPTGGVNDLLNRKLCLTGSNCLIDDPIRILRGYRLAGLNRLSINSSCRRAFASSCTGLRYVSGERIGQEIIGLLSQAKSCSILRMMADDGVLSAIAPEIGWLSGLYQNRYHHLDALEHTLATLFESEKLLENPPAWLREKSSADQLSPISIKLAALFHDVGKYSTYKVKRDGGLSFYGHARKSAELWNNVGLRFKYSTNLIKSVNNLIANHMRPLSIILSKKPTEKAIRRVARRINSMIEDLGVLVLADSYATNGPHRQHDWENKVNVLFSKMLSVRDQMHYHKLDPIISGHDIIKNLNIPQGPQIGRLLDKISEARLEGKVSTHQQALALAKKILKDERNG